MGRWLGGLALLIAMAVSQRGVQASCIGDCGKDGSVTVDELLLGVNIALGSALASQCEPFDDNHDQQVTIDEILNAVGNALNGCPMGNFAGDYSAAASFDATHSGTINLSADATGQVSGSLLATSSLLALRFHPNLSFTFPVGGFSVAVSGTYDPVTGGFEVEGSFVDGNGQTTSVVISGNLPGPTGSAPINVYVGSDMFSTTLSAGMLATPTPTPKPTTPGSGPRIVFANGAPSHIFVINPNGSGKNQISNSAGNDSNPAWSPDGTQIAFSTPYKTGIGIAVMNADGGDPHVITTEDSQLDYNPAWSPDGSRIVFTYSSGDGIDIMDANGSNRHRLVTKAQGESYGQLSWSPDGNRIAFASTRPRDNGHVREEIWVMDANGSNFVRLTTNELEDNYPDWSPDGQTILFGREGIAAGVYRINPGGSGEMPFISDPFVFAVPSPKWSQDGLQVIYQTLFGLKITDANGKNAVTVPGTNFVADFDFR